MTDHEGGHDPGTDASRTDGQRATLRQRRQHSVRRYNGSDEPSADGPRDDSLDVDSPNGDSPNGGSLDVDSPSGGSLDGESPSVPGRAGAKQAALTHTVTGPGTRPPIRKKTVGGEDGALKKLAGAVSALSSRFRGGWSGEEPADSTAGPGTWACGEAAEQEWERELKLSLREAEVFDVARVCIGSPKGGIGKSSLAYAFAGAVARYTNLRVALVDVDPNFGSLRTLVPRPSQASVLDLAAEANEIRGLSQMRNYVSKNDKMGLDIVLGPAEEYELAAVEDLGAVYKAADAVLSEFYDVVIYDMGVGFRDPAIREVLDFCDEFVLAVDAEQVTNTMVARAIKYLETLEVGLSRHTSTLVINHLRPPAEESASAFSIREAHTSLLGHRRVTEIPYDAQMSQLLNDRSFDIEEQAMSTRLRVLLTVGAVLKCLQQNRPQAPGTAIPAEDGGGREAGSHH